MKKFIAFSFMFALPVLTFAQSGGSVDNADDLIRKINNIFSAAIPLFITFAVVYLIYGIVRYIIATEEEGREKGKSIVLWGILGLFLILSIWGIVRILVNTADLNNTAPTNEIPQVIKTNVNIGGN